MSPLPAVRHVTLMPCRGEENPAVHVHYSEPLEQHHQGMILDALGTYVLELRGETFTPEFGEEAVLLRPANRQGRIDHERLLALSRHFGFDPPNNELHYATPSECAHDVQGELIEDVAHETSMVH